MTDSYYKMEENKEQSKIENKEEHKTEISENNHKQHNEHKTHKENKESKQIKLDITKIKTHLPLIAIIAFFLVLHFTLTSPLIALPSPIYGGDYYYQLGQTQHVKYGGSSLESATINGALPGYFVLYTTIAGNISKILNLDAIKTEFILSYIFIVLSVIIMFTLSKKLFKNSLLAAITCLIFISAHRIPVIKYTDFAYLIMMPLLFLTTYYYINDRSIKNSIILGLLYGLIGLTHSVAFISSSFFIVAVLIYYTLTPIIKEIKQNKKFNLKETKVLLPYIIIFAIGISIALLWWFKPLFIHHGHTSLNYTEWNNQNWGSISYQITFLWQTIKENLFNISDFRAILFSLFNIFGIVGLLTIKNKSKEIKYLSFILISSSIITFHYLITQNILNTNFIPDYMAFLILSPVLMLLFTFGVYFSFILLKKLLKNIKFDSKLFYIIIIALLLITQSTLYTKKTEDQWYNAGKAELPPYLTAFQEYAEENTDVYDTIITTKEVGFSVNAMTGRKLVVVRRAQNDPFLEMDQREMDVAIILYGNNTELKKELIKKYDIKYLYWDYYWIQSEYQYDRNGNLLGAFDPLFAFQSEEYEDQLTENNITYEIKNTWVDPALRGDHFKTFDLIYVSADNYYNQTHPWTPDLDPYLEKVWSYSQGTQEIAQLYKVNIE